MAGSLLPATMCRPSMEQQHQRLCDDLVVKFRSRAARRIEAEKMWRQKKCLFASKCSNSQGKQSALPTRCLPVNRLGQWTEEQTIPERRKWTKWKDFNHESNSTTARNREFAGPRKNNLTSERSKTWAGTLKNSKIKEKNWSSDE
jgi:hypothetical protein